MSDMTMKNWRDLPLRSFFTLGDVVCQKNSHTTYLQVNNPMLGESMATTATSKALKPYVQQPNTPAPVEPKNPEVFETKIVERKPVDPLFGAKTVTVTNTDSHIVEQGIQPPKDTGKRKKAKKEPETPVQPTEVKPETSEEN